MKCKINDFIPEKSYTLKGILDRAYKLDVDFVFNNKSISTLEVETLLNSFVTDSNNLDNNIFYINNSKQNQEKRYSQPPFITSTLQQQAQKDYGFKVSYTMSLAQKLYEGGYITYMRTDSTYINPDFEELLKQNIINNFGNKYYTHRIQKKIKGAQEAHEAIRPTKLDIQLPDIYGENETKLYNLILKKTIQPTCHQLFIKFLLYHL